MNNCPGRQGNEKGEAKHEGLTNGRCRNEGFTSQLFPLLHQGCRDKALAISFPFPSPTDVDAACFFTAWKWGTTYTDFGGAAALDFRGALACRFTLGVLDL